MSQLLNRLEDRLLVESDEYLRAELRAKRAAYKARVGDFGEARREIGAIRSVFGDGRSGRVTVLLMIAEAVLVHFESLGEIALDRIRRAQVLAQAGCDQELMAITSAWRAYLEFEKSAFELSAIAIDNASSAASKSDDATRARIAATLSAAFAWCGENEAAQKFFLSGREHALRDGDQAGLGALLHNKAVFSAARLGAMSCVRRIDPESLTMARAEIKSAKNFQCLTKIEALAGCIDIADARLCVLEGDYSGALKKLAQLRSAGPYPEGCFGPMLSAIEQAYCFAKLGQLDSALECYGAVCEAELSGVEADDLLVATWQLLALSRIDKRFGSVDARVFAHESAHSDYLKLIERAKSAFGRFASA